MAAAKKKPAAKKAPAKKAPAKKAKKKQFLLLLKVLKRVPNLERVFFIRVLRLCVLLVCVIITQIA